MDIDHKDIGVSRQALEYAISRKAFSKRLALKIHVASLGKINLLGLLYPGVNIKKLVRYERRRRDIKPIRHQPQTTPLFNMDKIYEGYISE